MSEPTAGANNDVEMRDPDSTDPHAASAAEMSSTEPFDDDHDWDWDRPTRVIRYAPPPAPAPRVRITRRGVRFIARRRRIRARCRTRQFLSDAPFRAVRLPRDTRA